jgi:hypothetical protein
VARLTEFHRQHPGTHLSSGPRDVHTTPVASGHASPPPSSQHHHAYLGACVTPTAGPLQLGASELRDRSCGPEIRWHGHSTASRRRGAGGQRPAARHPTGDATARSIDRRDGGMQATVLRQASASEGHAWPARTVTVKHLCLCQIRQKGCT